MCTRLEEIRDILFPGKIPYGMTNAQAWDKIMTSQDADFLQHPLVPEFRRDVLRIKDMTVDIFLLTIQELYGPIFSKLAAHLVRFVNGKIPKTMEDVENMFESIGVVPDYRRKVVIFQLIQPMNLPPTTIPTNIQTTKPPGLLGKKKKKKKGKKHQNRG